MEDESKAETASITESSSITSPFFADSTVNTDGTHNIGHNAGIDPQPKQTSFSQQGPHNVGHNAGINPHAVQVSQPQQGTRNVGNNSGINPQPVQVSHSQQGTRSVGIDGSAPPPITFIELTAYAGVSAGMSSALLSFLQLSRTDSHKPFQSHRIVSFITVGVLLSIMVGLCVAAIIQRWEPFRGLFVILCYIMCALALISCVLVVVLLCLH